MSFIQFESGTEKEKAREELRNARNELLKRAEEQYNRRQQEKIDKKFSGNDDWMLPSVAKKIDDLTKQTRKKSKKEKREKKKKKNDKSKKKKQRKSSNSDSESSLASSQNDDNISSKKNHYTASSSENEWVEKPAIVPKNEISQPLVRDDWMSGIFISTYSNKDGQSKRTQMMPKTELYDPAKSSRELNPHWQNGGTGIPAFIKPVDNDLNQINKKTIHCYGGHQKGVGNWRKKIDKIDAKHSIRDRSRSSEGLQDNRSPRRECSYSPKKKNDRRDSPSQRNNHNNNSPDKNDLSKNNRENSSRNDRSKSPKNNYSISSRNYGSKSPINDRNNSLRRRNDSRSKERSKSPQERCDDRKNFLTDNQMNELAAKILKAELMGNDQLANELNEKLKNARAYKNTYKLEFTRKQSTITAPKNVNADNEILLTLTDQKGISRPVCRQQKTMTKEIDRWGGRKAKKAKKIDTHLANERICYYGDDDKYNLKQMFEKEKFTSSHDQDAEFVRTITRKREDKNDDLDEVFAANIQHQKTDRQLDTVERERAIQEHRRIANALDSCDKCFDSEKMQKQLIVSMGTNVYLSLPWHEGLQSGHCLIIPIQHVSCSTMLDEDVWNEIIDYQKALCQMFHAQSKDVLFFETVRNLHRRPHMVIHCVPNANFELAPFFFKKAIQESEHEWSTNKQLITLKEKNVRKSIPKGLPYFWIHFGMDNGFAHVIEEQDRFPSNFAQEIIGGLLNLDPRQWRRPRRESNAITKVQQFADWWKPFDCNSNI